MAKFSIANGEITLSKELNDIDNFVIKTARILSKYTDYVIISGYVAIFFGRSRASEDVDMFIKELPIDKFRSMYKEFVDSGFEWHIDNPDELYKEYLKTGTPVSVWEERFPLLRLDVKFPTKPSQRLLLTDKIKVVFGNNTLWMANIESTIAYKEQIAKSEKDILDSKHLRLVFDGLDAAKIERYKRLFNQEFN